jgi:hypothetical protein
LENEMRSEQPAPGLQKATQQRRRHIEWWIRHNLVRPSGQAEISGVRPNDDDGRTEALAQHPGPASMRLDGDYTSARLQQRRCHGPNSGTDIDDERAGGYGRLSDELPCPSGVELMPCPAPLAGAHGGGP